MPVGDTRIEATALEAIPGDNAMVVVLSPPFAKFTGCADRTEKYWQGVAQKTGGLVVALWEWQCASRGLCEWRVGVGLQSMLVW